MIVEFLGRFHPVLVHLPIGILLLACIFQLATVKPRFSFLQPVIPVIIFWGILGAVASAISGYFLSLSGDYEGSLVQWHQWFGIAVALLSLGLYLLYKRTIRVKYIRVTALLLIVLISVTGHLGGSLTHGSEYLTEPLTKNSSSVSPVKPLPNIQQAAVYGDMVQPVLQARCYSCHGPDKQKGKLRLDLPDLMMKGGKNGKVIVAGSAEESELIRHILLPLESDDHMPPKEKPQLSANEIALLHWWISNGADFSKKVNQLVQTEKTKPMLAAFQSGSSGGAAEPKGNPDVPEGDVNAADERAVKELGEAGIMVMPVGQQTNYLSANFVTASTLDEKTMKLLNSIGKQLIWLKIERADAGDKQLKMVGECSELRRLHLNNCKITDAGLKELKKLTKLQILNLSGTEITAKGLLQLNNLKQLRSVFLYQTKISPADIPALKKAFPKTHLDYGNYQVSTLVQDTVEVKEPQKQSDKQDPVK